MFLVRAFEKYKDEGLFIFYFYWKKALNTSYLTPDLTLYLVFSVCSRITEKEDEAFFIFLFWVVEP